MSRRNSMSISELRSECSRRGMTAVKARSRSEVTISAGRDFFASMVIDEQGYVCKSAFAHIIDPTVQPLF